MAGAAAEPEPVRFDRQVLVVDIELPDCAILPVFNLHLRAPIASALVGQKLSPQCWRSTGAWAEGYYLSELRRAAQALEVRLAVDELLARDEAAQIVVCGDFNAVDRDAPLDILVAAEEDTGNPMLSAQSLVMLDRSIPIDRRFSVLHHGRPQMLDHVLVSRQMSGHFRQAEAHNEALGDEAIGFARHVEAAGSYHAALVASFTMPFEAAL
jgi:endonuclease/exonuclease/phosphatase family metal-dependent hydrolase